MDAETITAASDALSGPASAILVLLLLLFGVYRISIKLLAPFLTSVAESIKNGFEEQSSALTKLVDEIKIDREVQKTISAKVDDLERDVSDIKNDVSEIKTFIKH